MDQPRDRRTEMLIRRHRCPYCGHSRSTRTFGYGYGEGKGKSTKKRITDWTALEVET